MQFRSEAGRPAKRCFRVYEFGAVGRIRSFSVPPKTAYAPDPADGSEFVDPEADLGWTAGFGAKLHTVYLGNSFADVLYDKPITHQDPVYMNRGGQAFIIDGGYKLVTEDGKNWSLYNLNEEETEITDLSQEEPERFNTLLSKYKAWRDSIK